MQWTLLLPAMILWTSSALGEHVSTCDTFNESNSPCHCNPGGFFRLVCTNVTDLHTLVRILREASEANLVEVSVRYSTMDSIPLETVGFLGYLFLNLKSVSLKTLFNGVPASRVNLEQLHLDNVEAEAPWSWQPLASLMDLKRLSISRMPMEYVNENLTDYISQTLQSLALTSTETKEISSTAFSKFTELVYVSVQNTDIQELKRSMFAEASKIKFFYFGRNQISHLPEDIFSNMDHLLHVGLQDNAISEISFPVFGTVWRNLSALFLAGNPIKCHCTIAWITFKKHPFILTGRCQAPKDKYGKSLKSLNKYDSFC